MFYNDINMNVPLIIRKIFQDSMNWPDQSKWIRQHTDFDILN